MDFQVDEKGPVLRRVEGTITGEALGEEERKAYAKLRTSSKLKGFRHGKVPRSVLQRMYGKQVRAESMQVLVQDAVKEIVEDIPDLIHVSPWRLLDEETTDGGFRFELEVEIKPEVEVSDYSGLEVAAPPAVVSDEQVEEAIEQLREQFTTLEPVTDRDVCEPGDLVSIDYEAEGEGPLEQLRNTEQLVELGSGTAIPGLEAGLEGAKLGEERRIEVQMPDPFPAIPQVAGETIALKVTPRAIKQKQVPELDDELARQTGEAETLDELRQTHRERLETQAAERRSAAVRRRVLETLRERFPFELPQGYIDSRTEQRMAEQRRYLMAQGISPEYVNQLLGGARDTLREEVARSVQDEVILASVARQEQIEVSDEEREAYLTERAERTQMPPARLKRLYATPEMRESLDMELRLEKALDLLVERATVVDEEPQSEDEAETVASEAPSEAEQS